MNMSESPSVDEPKSLSPVLSPSSAGEAHFTEHSTLNLDWFIDWRKTKNVEPTPVESVTEERFLRMLLDQAQKDDAVPPALTQADTVEAEAQLPVKNDQSDESMDDSEEDDETDSDKSMSDDEYQERTNDLSPSSTHSPEQSPLPSPSLKPNTIQSPRSQSQQQKSSILSPSSEHSSPVHLAEQSESDHESIEPLIAEDDESTSAVDNHVAPISLINTHIQNAVRAEAGRVFHVGASLPEFDAFPPAPVIKSIFDELYAIPDSTKSEAKQVTESCLELSESETESESDDVLIERTSHIRHTTINHHSYAVVPDDSIFGWNWPLSVAANQSLINLSNVSIPPNLEAGVVLDDGFDLPPPALAYSIIAPVTLEEQEEELARQRHVSEAEAIASLPLEFQYRIKELSTQLQLQRSSPQLASSDAYSPATVVSMLDPPMPSQPWRAVWQQICRQLPNVTLTHVWPKLPTSSPTPAAQSSSPSRSASPTNDNPAIPNYSVCRLPAPPTRVHAQIIANMALREMRFRAAHSFRLMKERASVVARVNREVANYWKKHDKEVIEMRRKLDREEAEKRKKLQEAREAERQKKKLEFLLTQTELYSHFIGSKMGLIDPNARPKLETSANAADLKSYEDNERIAAMNEEAAEAAKRLMTDRQKQISQFDVDLASTQGTAHAQQLALTSNHPPEDQPIDLLNPSTMPQQAEFYSCPESFNGELKSYQLKGLNWLINLYDQGINGILADEMGLGKTIQSIVFLAFLASQRQLYGPFLVVCPNSTLHQWQQEVTKFCPTLKVMPYWGTQQERAVIRKFWQPSQLSQPDSPFHVLVTSYHIMVSDAKYFQRIKWQYLICDEAQSLKNAASQRWKSLLNLKCRNRVLLTGTPIQNSMAELWALLHFIMPEFFDNHAEFNEWFSKDIEEQAENALQSQKNRQLARLHLILKPFMLRRVKKDVENEMPPKVELLVDCPLSTRQRFHYRQLQRRVRSTGTEKIMNIAMQFRKVCNHPTLFIARSALSSLNFIREHSFAAHRVYGLTQSIEVYSTAARWDGNAIELVLPACVMDAGLDLGKNRFLYHILNFNNAHAISQSLKEDKQSGFAWSRFCGLSPAELAFMMRADPLFLMLAHASRNQIISQTRAHQAYNSLVFNSVNQSHLSSSLITSEEQFSPNHDAQFLQPTMLLITSLSPSLPNPHLTPSPPSVMRVLCEKSSMRNSITLVSKSGDERSEVAADLAVQEAMTLVDNRYEMVPFELDPSQLHCNNDPNQLFAHRRNLLRTLRSAYLPRVTAPPIYPYLPGNSNVWLRARMGAPEYSGWERSVFTGFDHIGASKSSPLPLSPNVRPPASFSNAASVAPTGLLGRWTDITHPMCAQPLPYHQVQHLVNQIVLPYHVVESLYQSINETASFHSLLIPTTYSLVHDSGKLARLDALLSKLYANGHRVLIFSQMTRMLDLIGELLHHRRYSHLRLDGQTSLASRRDMVRAYQTDPSIFCFILSTRAGGLGINLTAADTVIFYDNDWNPTNDAQAMDRSHRIGQTKSVTVYRLVCRHTVEERILNRAQVKHNIQNSVYSGGFKMSEEQEAAQAMLEEAPSEPVQGGDDDALDTQHFFGERELRDLMLSEEPATTGSDSIQPLSRPKFSAFDDMQMEAEIDLNDEFEAPVTKTTSSKPVTSKASRSSPSPSPDSQSASQPSDRSVTPAPSTKPKTKKELQKEAAAIRIAERKAATLARQNAREEEKRKRADERAEKSRLRAEEKAKQLQDKGRSETVKGTKTSSSSTKPRAKRQRSESSKTDKEKSRKKAKLESTQSSSSSSSSSSSDSSSGSSSDSSTDEDESNKRRPTSSKEKKSSSSKKRERKPVDVIIEPIVHQPAAAAGMMMEITRAESFV